ncbi:prepilin-type N-terminal cleavage/methylation domain-containing protein [Solidesulfovibrio magneticus]|uniref:prepilin-type N-terminal cleavage/methylation domain-containing protein n=1 Tax=Solidesulfovibrio magneticus TaxID=184917 RepID=UPI0009D737EC
MKRKHGFTLIEVILTLVILAIAASMVMPYFMSGALTSANPMNNVSTPLTLQTVMSKIVSDYNSNFGTTNLPSLASLATKILYTSNNIYGIDSNFIVTVDQNYKFDSNDTDTSLKVTLTNNQGISKESLTYIFTKK